MFANAGSPCYSHHTAKHISKLWHIHSLYGWESRGWRLWFASHCLPAKQISVTKRSQQRIIYCQQHPVLFITLFTTNTLLASKSIILFYCIPMRSLKESHECKWRRVMSVKNAGKVTNNLNCWRHDLMQISYIWFNFTHRIWTRYRQCIVYKWVNINQIQGMGGKLCLSITFVPVLLIASTQ